MLSILGVGFALALPAFIGAWGIAGVELLLEEPSAILSRSPCASNLGSACLAATSCRLLPRTRVSSLCVQEALDTCTQLRVHGLKTRVVGDLRGGEQSGDTGHGGHTDLLVTGVL